MEEDKDGGAHRGGMMIEVPEEIEMIGRQPEISIGKNLRDSEIIIVEMMEKINLDGLMLTIGRPEEMIDHHHPEEMIDHHPEIDSISEMTIEEDIAVALARAEEIKQGDWTERPEEMTEGVEDLIEMTIDMKEMTEEEEEADIGERKGQVKEKVVGMIEEVVYIVEKIEIEQIELEDMVEMIEMEAGMTEMTEEEIGVADPSEIEGMIGLVESWIVSLLPE